MKKENKPNYDMMLQSAITCLQVSYNEYKKALFDYYNMIFYNSSGDLCVLNGFEDKFNDIKKLASDVETYKLRVNELKEMINIDLDLKIKESESDKSEEH